MSENARKKVYEKKVLIKNKQGLHARPAALLVQTANRFKCEIEILKGRQKVNGKSIMGIMTLAAGAGTSLTIRTQGEDAAAAMEEILKLIDGDFGE